MAKKKTRISRPVIKRQTGDFQQTQSLKLDLPLQLLMLCKVINVTPQQLITDFIDNLSFGTWKREGRERARELLKDYFLEHGYGQEVFSQDELRSIFQELDAISLLFPKDAEPEVLSAYSSWRQAYQGYWLEKWLHK